MTLKVAVLVGSLRTDSINKKLANALVKLLPADVTVTFPSLAELPVYNMDFEGKRPEAVNTFTAQLNDADAFIVVTPEHNRAVSTALKNAFDWASIPASPFRNKLVFVTGTSPGAISSALAQQQAKSILGGILGALVLGGEAYVQFKEDLITAEGTVGEGSNKFLQGHIDNFVNVAKKLAA